MNTRNTIYRSPQMDTDGPRLEPIGEVREDAEPSEGVTVDQVRRFGLGFARTAGRRIATYITEVGRCKQAAIEVAGLNDRQRVLIRHYYIANSQLSEGRYVTDAISAGVPFSPSKDAFVEYDGNPFD